MGIETAIIGSALLGAGTSAYAGHKERKAQKAYKAEQSAIQQKAEAQALDERKTQIDQMRQRLLRPQLTGGRRSLIATSESGVQQGGAQVLG